MTMSDGNFAKKLSPIMEDFEEEKLKRWESDESTNVCEEFISRVIWAISIIFIVVTFPFSLCVSIRMVQVRNLKVIIFYLYIERISFRYDVARENDNLIEFIYAIFFLKLFLNTFFRNINGLSYFDWDVLSEEVLLVQDFSL